MIFARIVCLIALLPATAFAEKVYTKETSATHDCNKEPKVQINVSNGNFTLTGTCEMVGVNSSNTTVKIETVNKLGVNGSKVTVTVETVTKLGVNGNGNVVNGTSIGNVGINGNDNLVTYKSGAKNQPKPGVGIAGKNNKVVKATP